MADITSKSIMKNLQNCGSNSLITKLVVMEHLIDKESKLQPRSKDNTEVIRIERKTTIKRRVMMAGIEIADHIKHLNIFKYK